MRKKVHEDAWESARGRHEDAWESARGRHEDAWEDAWGSGDSASPQAAVPLRDRFIPERGRIS